MTGEDTIAWLNGQIAQYEEGLVMLRSGKLTANERSDGGVMLNRTPEMIEHYERVIAGLRLAVTEAQRS